MCHPRSSALLREPVGDGRKKRKLHLLLLYLNVSAPASHIILWSSEKLKVERLKKLFYLLNLSTRALSFEA